MERCFVFVRHRVSLRGKATADCFPLALYASTTIPRINYVTAATSPRATLLLPPLNHPPSLPPSPPPPLIHFHFLFQLLRPHRTFASVIYPRFRSPTIYRRCSENQTVFSFRDGTFDAHEFDSTIHEERKIDDIEGSRRVRSRFMVSVF